MGVSKVISLQEVPAKLGGSPQIITPYFFFSFYISKLQQRLCKGKSASAQDSTTITFWAKNLAN